jgi:acetyl esterase/lipase
VAKVTGIGSCEGPIDRNVYDHYTVTGESSHRPPVGPAEIVAPVDRLPTAIMGLQNLFFPRSDAMLMKTFRRRLDPLGIHAGLIGAVVTLALPATVGAQDEVATPVAERSGSRSKTDDIKVLTDQRFSQAEGKAGLCDVYLPGCQPPAEGFPAVVVIHGGGWTFGDKWSLAGYSRMLADGGFAAITINYRLAPQHKFPAQVDDVRDALVWTAKNAERFSIDLNRLGLCGYSAGGHLSTLVAALADEPLAVRAAASEWPTHDARWKQLPAIHAVCAGGPPCDFRSLPIDNTSIAYFLGGSRRQVPEAYVAASPTAHVSRNDPATQLIHGETDLLVPIASTQRLHEAQKAVGVDSRFQIMPKQGHMITFLNPKTARKMVEFFTEMFYGN